MITSSKAIDKLLFQYTHLPIFKKQVKCPYWMDKIKKKIWGPYGGKGSPQELVRATLEVGAKKKINLAKLTSQQIRVFMKKNRIGLDCSGLAFKLLNTLDKEKGGNGLEDDIPGVKGKFLLRANVMMLTNDEVSLPIKKLRDLAVGDLIRLGEGKHLAVIVEIKRGSKGQIKEIVYAHSSPGTVPDGVHKARILIKDGNYGLEAQKWLERTKKGENYGQKFFKPEKGDGIRRLRIWT
ncbi:MAG: hypothetical protein ACOZBZ_04110 [Patescibacteria group bacterium]